MNSIQAEPGEQTTKLQQVLGLGSGGGGLGRRYLRWLIPLAALFIVVLGYRYLGGDDDANSSQYKTEPAIVGTLVVKVSATGTLQPTNQVGVGSELSGIVEAVYVDDNDHVKKGQVLARLDVSKLQDAVAKSRANLGAAEAQVLLAQATVAEARANLGRFEQVAELSGGKVPSKSELDTADANLKRAEADEAGAQASVAQARATLRSDETNLEKAQIRSPINGVVLNRQVEPGQTVAASFQAPVLFTLAEDLSQMELQVDVDEADVGQVREGQQAVFTVDAWPGREYPATIIRVGYGSQEKEGVVSYPATLQVDNSDLSLRPGMTATAEITTLTRENVLLVPNAALRFVPPAPPSNAEKKTSRGLVGALMPRRHTTQTRPGTDLSAGNTHQVWVLHDGEVLPVSVHTGPSNGRVTEIVGGDLQAGMEVITEAVGNQP